MRLLTSEEVKIIKNSLEAAKNPDSAHSPYESSSRDFANIGTQQHRPQHNKTQQHPSRKEQVRRTLNLNSSSRQKNAPAEPSPLPHLGLRAVIHSLEDFNDGD